MEKCELENALSLLQCTLVAQRTRYTPEQVTWGQYDILELLRLRGDLTPSQLSDSLAISRQNLSKFMRGLKSLGFIAQYRSEKDKRELITHLTDEGHAFLARAALGRKQNAEKISECLTLGEQTLFIELSQKIISALTPDKSAMDND
ncbi:MULTISPECIES: MarR family winged helix-turn-helix transcriptional regulator [Proteus]|uniref:MarR family winged helix-turn-helix transcriptional regulator n=1 Tax=Proteus TaxID=583 RepID=UPI000BFD63BD|nr:MULTISPECIES: MarR family transcriptional regulator [Proteus]ATM99993.1 MarR family transcriptional regulator [Proteus vulgaris]MBG2836835.1 MarR family transcriptional regulator [Proteus terrae subsp. cibarius]MBG2867850.1 MarR family transcriptional regulator [Proteus terrae subsp. cibarius]MBJ2108471.1 MarR family transcriptional regulator [Proteus terrae]MBJ2131266.1 MarR family transcriptional regulator [Proteus terrae]